MLPPALPGLPLLGNALEFYQDRYALLRKGYEQLGPIFSIRLGRQPTLVLIGPELQQFFFNETDKSLNMDKPYPFLKALFGPVAFLASPEVYQEQRPILHSPFQREKMLKYAQIMQREVQKWLDGLGQSGEMNLVTEMNRLVQEVAGRALMGDEFQAKVGREFWDLYTVLAKSLNPLMPSHWPLPANIKRDWAKGKMREMLTPIILDRRQNPENYDDFLQDFLNTRGKSGQPADDATITGLIQALMFASHETTAGQAAWTLVELSRHPDYLARVRAEIGQQAPAGTTLDGRVMRQLTHVAWAVREIERLHPSTDLLLRVSEKAFDLGGYHIPKDWAVMVSPAVAHRLPQLFTDPERFDPLRFAPGREEDSQHRFALFGFGGGLHKCAGINFANNEMMIITTLLFQQFNLTLLPPEPRPNLSFGASRPDKALVRYQRLTTFPSHTS